jgi:hypothetical protein
MEPHDATHQPTTAGGRPLDVITLPEGTDPATSARWRDLFQRSGATQEQVNRMLEWHHLLLRDPQQAEEAAQDEARQAVLDARDARAAGEMARALSVRRLSGQTLSAKEDADMKEAYRQLAARQPPGAPPRYDASRGW